MNEDVDGFARSFRDFLHRMNEAAAASAPSPLRELLDAHMGDETESIPVIAASFPTWDHANVQVAMEAWLTEPGRSHELIGLMGQQRHFGSLSDVLEASRHAAIRVGSVDLIELPTGPDATLPCVNFGLFLVADGDHSLVVMMRGPDERYGHDGILLEIVCRDTDRARAMLADIRRLMVELNVFRGQVVAFGESHMGRPGVGPLVFLRRPDLGRDDLVLAPGVLESIEREVIGIARHRDRLRAARQHVKRGLLLHGPPGTGKTLTVRFLLTRLQEHTVLLLTGGGLGMVRPACSLARMLQPSIVVLEDIDLVAQDRGMTPWGSSPVLFEILNEMDGMAEDADVTFLLTTNRADLLEPALAARPGRVDLAVQIGLPDAEARHRLIQLYGLGLDLRLSDEAGVVQRTEGVTASFVKELMRKAALAAAEAETEVGTGEPPVVTDAEVGAALDELLSEGAALTRVLLGGAGDGDGGDAPESPRPGTGWLATPAWTSSEGTIYGTLQE